MIDEFWLNQLERSVRFDEDAKLERQALPFNEMVELIRIARLGLWATEHAVPVLQENASRGHKLAAKALAALPKEDE